MNIAVIFAGGTGQRMNTSSKPKQFLDVHGKPVLIYTLEVFSNHPMIDKIILVCLDSYITYCKKIIKKWDVSKVEKIISGGKSGQESIFKGLKSAYEYCPEDSIVLIHDGVRPLIDEATISKDIMSVKKYGSAITISSAVETVIIKNKNDEVGTILNRSNCEIAKAPQCFYLRDIYKAHLKALDENNVNFIDSASLMHHYGYKLSTVECPAENIKITTPSDFYIFRAIIDAKENLQIIGL